MVTGMGTQILSYNSIESHDLFCLFVSHSICLGSCQRIRPYFYSSKIGSSNRAMKNNERQCLRCRWLHFCLCTSWPAFTLPLFFPVQPFIFSLLSHQSSSPHFSFGSQSLKASQWYAILQLFGFPILFVGLHSARLRAIKQNTNCWPLITLIHHPSNLFQFVVFFGDDSEY